jgi:hypothetical protein
MAANTMRASKTPKTMRSSSWERLLGAVAETLSVLIGWSGKILTPFTHTFERKAGVFANSHPAG